MPEIITTISDFNERIKNNGLTVVHFSADWADQCKQVDEVLDALASQKDYSKVRFVKLDAEDLSKLSLDYKIESVPTITYFKASQCIDKVDGADAAKITSKVCEHIGKDGQALDNRLKALVNRSKIMLFMKGDRVTPRCGFSRTIIEILNGTGAAYDTFDILSDEEVRQGLKTYSNWPTYPQLYANGELIGGLDIIKELQAEGELLNTLNA